MTSRPNPIRQLRATRRCARVRHACGSCGGWIEPGEAYVDFVGRDEDDGTLAAEKAHEACFELEEATEGYGVGPRIQDCLPSAVDFPFDSKIDRARFLERCAADRFPGEVLRDAIAHLGRCRGGPEIPPYDLPGERR